MAINKGDLPPLPPENREETFSENTPIEKTNTAPDDSYKEASALPPVVGDDLAQEIEVFEEALSQNRPEITNPLTPETEGISFIPNEQVANTELIKIAMEHRNPDPSCPLCPVSGPMVNPRDPKALETAHQEALLLWSEWDPSDPNKEWVARVIAKAAELGIAVDAEQVEEHFSEKHRIEQPALPGQIMNESFMEATQELLPRERVLIEALYKQKVLTTPQITEVFYTENKKGRAAAKKKAQGDLKNLAQKHFLFRYFPSEADIALKARPPQFAKLALWYTGKRSLPFLMNEYDLTFQPPYINGAATVNNETMMHDIRANEVFVSLARAINDHEGKFDTPWGRLTISHDPQNWYGPGPRSLSMGFQDPTTLMWNRMKPDGFATLSIQRSRQLAKSLLPFWIEYDRGTKDTKDVAEQLLVYHLLALSGAAGKRFPDLAAPEYAIPVIMVFYDKKQLHSVSKRLLEMAKEYGIERGAPIFLALDADWKKDPFAAETTIYAWTGEKGSFLEYLVRASQPLHEARALTPGQTLTLDPGGAPYRTEGALSESGKAQGREAIERRREEEEEKERKASIRASLARMKREAEARAGKASGLDSQSTPGPISKSASQSMPEPIPEPIVEQTPEPTSEPIAEQTPEPVSKPAPQPIPEPTPEPIVEQTPKPTPEPTPEPIPEPTPEPVSKPAPQPIPEPIPEPIVEQTHEPTPENIPEPTPEPTFEPKPEALSEPVPEPAANNQNQQIVYDPNDPFAPGSPPVVPAPAAEETSFDTTAQEVARLKAELAKAQAQLLEIEDGNKGSPPDNGVTQEPQGAMPTEALTGQTPLTQEATDFIPEPEIHDPLLNVSLDGDSSSSKPEVIAPAAVNEHIPSDITDDRPPLKQEQAEEKDLYVPAYEEPFSSNISSDPSTETIDEIVPSFSFPDLEAEIKSAASPKPMLQNPQTKPPAPAQPPTMPAQIPTTPKPPVVSPSQAGQQNQGASQPLTSPKQQPQRPPASPPGTETPSGAEPGENIEEWINSEAASRRARRRKSP